MKLNVSTGTVTLEDGSASDVIKELSLIGNQPSAVDAELEALAEEALEADIAAKAAVAKQASTKAALKTALAEAGKLDQDTKAVGVVRTIIKPVRRFDAKLAEELLSPEEVAQYSAISSALVKANVAPTVYELMQADQGFSLELKVDTGK
jgi:hypothetical protein